MRIQSIFNAPVVAAKEVARTTKAVGGATVHHVSKAKVVKVVPVAAVTGVVFGVKGIGNVVTYPVKEINAYRADHKYCEMLRHEEEEYVASRAGEQVGDTAAS